jgi:hypothetical protein
LREILLPDEYKENLSLDVAYYLPDKGPSLDVPLEFSRLLYLCQSAAVLTLI